MNDYKTLSPAARAVRLAAINAEPGQTISAALRAVANQLRGAYQNEEYVDPADDYLDSIATELENIQ